VSQALYRRYRPERFADLIGQEHVTEPLSAALTHNRVSHAYLFSGPRGCGKTTSARILARCLNCEQGPTAEPCGTCQSCIDLARGGPGSIDVIEIDAASHGGVEDARELRDKAFYSPAVSRYKIYIIDEAHMVSPQGFNALLKVVEEPPEHVKFVFATTEPEKVIGTIKSRTHHYPFRLVPSRILEDYLQMVCEQEGVTVDPGVLSLVVRSGAGSVRDSLSVLDQLIGGAESSTLTYERAVQLLGFTPAALLDEIADAIADSDGSAMFGVVENVIEKGLDPERFMKDLLERLRDLVVVAAVDDAFEKRLIAASDDQRDRLQSQADRIGLAALTRCTELVAAGLTELKGPTSPRLQLELVCAKLLLPGAHRDELSLATRLERLERRLAIAGSPGEVMTSTPTPTTETRPAPVPAPAPPVTRSVPNPAPRSAPPTDAADAVPSEPEAADAVPSGPEADAPSDAASDEPAAAATTRLDLHEVRRLWPSVLDRVKGYRRVTWAQLFEKSEVLDVDDRQLSLGLSDIGAHRAFSQGGHDEIVRQALIDVIGLDVQVTALLDPSAKGSAKTRESDAARTQARPTPQAASDARAAAAAVERPVVGKARADAPVEDDAAADDADADDDGLSGADLVAQQLGGKVIGEIDHH
jgi:DNA polymerase-3 subunit gamma/tau